MNKKGTIAKILPDGFVYTLNIIGIIAGTIITFILWDWGEFYTDQDGIEISGILTLILAVLYLVIYLLPIVICLLVGGGIGYFASFVVGIALDTLIYALVTFANRKREEFRIRREQKRASKQIKQSNKSISKDIERLHGLRSKLDIREYTKSTYHLCCLIDNIVSDKIGFKPCLEYSEEQYSVLNEIESIEKKIIRLAEQYKVVNDTKNAEYYFNIVGVK